MNMNRINSELLYCALRQERRRRTMIAFGRFIGSERSIILSSSPF